MLTFNYNITQHVEVQYNPKGLVFNSAFASYIKDVGSNVTVENYVQACLLFGRAHGYAAKTPYGHFMYKGVLIGETWNGINIVSLENAKVLK